MSGPESALWVREGGLPRGEVSSPQESSPELRSFRCRCAPIPVASSALQFWNMGSQAPGWVPGWGGGRVCRSWAQELPAESLSLPWQDPSAPGFSAPGAWPATVYAPLRGVPGGVAMTLSGPSLSPLSLSPLSGELSPEEGNG